MPPSFNKVPIPNPIVGVITMKLIFRHSFENCSITKISFVAGCKRGKVMYCFDGVRRSHGYTRHKSPRSNSQFID